MARLRTTVAFLVAPSVIPVGLSIAAAVSPGDSPVSFRDFLGLVVLFSLYALPPAYLLELVLGLPAWLVFHRNEIRAWSAFAAGGAVLGATYYAAYTGAKFAAAKTMAYDFASHPIARDLNPLSLWLAIPGGLTSAILFRAIVYPRQSREKPK